MKRLKYFAFIFVMLITLSIGCVKRANQPIEDTRNVDMSHPRAKLITGSNKLLNKVVIRDPRFRTVGQLNQAEVAVQNLTKNKYILEYKFDWTDQDGFTVDSHSMWHRFILTPHQVQNFNSTGKTPEATNIIFTIRLPDDAFIDLKED